ncbi:MAG: type I DNA topoisomerase [Bacteroidales bacterium]|nr:type I DNA topoisomerase [Bacteroidales bacterium]
MEGNLVIVESPGKVGTIQKFLGEGYVVKSSFGHIRDLQENALSIDIKNGFKPEYVIPADKKKTVKELKALASKAQTVWLASDEDREGEAISWHLFETLGLKKENTRRIVFHEITKEAIINAIANPRDIDMKLVDAQQARRVLDRLVGFELSPVLWRKIQPKLSAGRVQSVALRLIVDREREIMTFEKEPYYKVDAVFHPDGAAKGVNVKAGLDGKLKELAQAEELLNRLAGAAFKVESIEKKEGTRSPAAPFTTSTLQQEAARKLHFSVSQTMSIAQSLYEKGLITYMRTDSVNLSTLALGAAKKYITETFGKEYSRTRQYKTKAAGAQEAHEAIRPTYMDRTSIEGSAQEKKLYTLIWKKAIASQMADAKVLNTSMKVSHNHGTELFSSQASEVLFDGFLKVYMDTDDESQDTEALLPALNAGDALECLQVSADGKFTSAPPRYSEGTLVKKLEELEIGRPSTWASIINTLLKGRNYIVKGDKEGEKLEVVNLVLKKGTVTSSRKTETWGAEKGKLIPQEIGMIVTDYLVDHFGNILDYGFTANVEQEFDRIAGGELQWNSLIDGFYGPFHTSIEDNLHNGEYSRVEREIGRDADGSLYVARYGQYGPYVQKGEGENKAYASLAPGQLIESITLEEAVKLFELPRNLGSLDGTDIIVTKGRFGAYIKYGSLNVSLPKGSNPVNISLDECISLVQKAQTNASKPDIAFFEASDIRVIEGSYGPYIKHAGNNYRIPKGTDAATLSEEDCRKIIEESSPTQRKKVSFRGGKR